MTATPPGSDPATLPPGQQQYVPVSAAMTDGDQRLWSTLIHLSPLVAGIIGLPFLGPLIGYFVLRDRGDEIRFHTAQALNLQITALIASIASALLMLAFIGFLLLPAVGIVVTVFMIIAAVKAHQGQRWRIPLAIPFVK